MNLISSSLLSTLLILLTLSHPIRSASSTATTFCKCICFNNSTIIALNPPPSSTPGSHKFDIRSPHADPFYPYRPDPPVGKRDEDSEDSEGGGSTSPSRPHHKLTCADCTRAFCLDYHLPICKNAREEDVFTTCFRTRNPHISRPYLRSAPCDCLPTRAHLSLTFPPPLSFVPGLD